MNSETVYQVAKALPKEEQMLLLEKLKVDFSWFLKCKKVKKKPLEKEDAISYLLTKVFNKKKIKQ